jgi:pSer/pThr/pTyr-binding forkhead associated (FHA) protein
MSGSDAPLPPKVKTLLMPLDAPSVTDAAPMLLVVEGLEPGRRYPLAAATTTLGRSAANSIVLPSPAVSSEHARVVARDGQFWIEDLHSTNGVAVNGAMIRVDEPRLLGNGDAIRISDHLLLFHHPGAQHASSSSKIEIDRAAVARQVEELLGQVQGPRPPE